MNIAQDAIGKDASHHASRFQRHLLGRRQPIDAARDHALYRFRERHSLKIDIGRNPAFAFRDCDEASIAQCKGQFFAEERIAFRLLQNQMMDLLRQRVDA